MKITKTLEKLDKETLKQIKETGTFAIPEEVNVIKSFTLSCNSDLKSIVFKKNIEKIEKCALYACTNLRKIIFDCAPRVSFDAFVLSPKLESITFTAHAIECLGDRLFSFVQNLSNMFDKNISLCFERKDYQGFTILYSKNNQLMYQLDRILAQATEDKNKHHRLGE